MNICPPAGATSLPFSSAEIEEQRRAFERFDRESQDRLAMSLSETPTTHPDTSLDWLIAQQLAEQEVMVDCLPLDNEVPTDGGYPTSSCPEHSEAFQNRRGTMTSLEAMVTWGREDEVVAFEDGGTAELPSDPAHSGTVQSDFLLANQLYELDTPSVAPDDEQIMSDYILAKELQDLEAQSHQADHPDSRALPDHPQALLSNPDHQQLETDFLLAQALQEEHNTPVVELSHDERHVGEVLSSLDLARDFEVARSVDQEWNKQEDTDGDELLARQLQNEENETQSFDQIQSAHNLSPPLWWTVCPNCAPNAVRKYHLIDISPASEEWSRVTAPFTRVGYMVTKIQRIQNQRLLNRFHFERQSMKDERPAGRHLNEMLLYHTTSASKEVICEEGLDQRLSRQGRFGRGIYFRQAIITAELCSIYLPFLLIPFLLFPSLSALPFSSFLLSLLSFSLFSSDDPIKCNQYWGQGRPRLMFACCVLLGDIKVQLIMGSTGLIPIPKGSDLGMSLHAVNHGFTFLHI